MILRSQNPNSRISIDSRIFVSGNQETDPCETGEDRFYIEIDGRNSKEGNVSGSAG